jgi:hypothetical protein
MARHACYLLPLFLFGARTPLLAGEAISANAPAVRAFYLGKQALEKDRPDQAIGQFQLSLRLDPSLVQNHLSLAAAYLARGQDAQAAPHLARYVAARPDHHLVRAHFAELLLRLDHLDEARTHFERFSADVQDHPDLAGEHLVHCHSRLMEIAQAEGNDYAEHLHRGIGLYLLACQRAGLPEADLELTVEGLLFKAAAELTLARHERSDEARPCWYLYQVWSRLAQRQPATRWLRAAEAAAPFSALTPAERRQLQLACHRLPAEVGPR